MFDDRDVFSVIVYLCPTWLTKFLNSQYVETSEHFLMKLEIGVHSNIYTLNICNVLPQYWVKKILKCKYLKQMFVSSIDVGYECDDYNNEENVFFRNMGRKYYYPFTSSTE